MSFNSILGHGTRHYIISLRKKKLINDLPKPRTMLTFVHTQDHLRKASSAIPQRPCLSTDSSVVPRLNYWTGEENELPVPSTAVSYQFPQK